MHYLYTHEELDVATRSSLNGFARSAKIYGRSKMKVNELRDALRERLPPREGTSPGLFVELCAGTAAVSLQLHREGARPPVSRMGSKRGYAIAVLHALGLYPGLQADRYLWCEPDDGCRLLLETYRDHDLALKVAEIIRGWKDEDPRSLWERLRKEGPVKAPTPREVARWCLVKGWWIGGHSGRFGGEVIVSPGGGKHIPVTPEGYARRVEDLPTPPAEIKEEAVDPREVARSLVVDAWAFRAGNPDSGYNKSEAEGHPNSCKYPRSCLIISEETTSLPTLPAEVTDGAVEPPLLPPHTVVYIDPPYVNTTGYKHDLPRERVVELALAWYAAGAKVAISEQEAIPELIAQGWTAVDITDKRLGQKRTFSNQQKEYLTLSPGAQCSHL
jgi:hypothetical protein